MKRICVEICIWCVSGVVVVMVVGRGERVRERRCKNVYESWNPSGW